MDFSPPFLFPSCGARRNLYSVSMKEDGMGRKSNRPPMAIGGLTMILGIGWVDTIGYTQLDEVIALLVLKKTAA